MLEEILEVFIHLWEYGRAKSLLMENLQDCTHRWD